MFLNALMLMAACGEKDGTVDDTGTVDLFGTYVFVTDPEGNTKTEPAGGDLSCYTPGDAWLTNSADPSCQAEQAFTGIVEDFETGDEVPDATLELWWADSTTGAVDQETISSESGAVSGTLMSCTPFSYRTSTDADLEETVTTIQAHEVYGFRTDDHDAAFYSVSTTTYNIIPSLLGVTPEPGKGIAAGTAYDCNGDPVEFVQVITKDSDGNIVEGQIVKYFREEFPNRDQYWTSDDGLWVIVNIPPGTVSVEMYGLNAAGEHELLGTTILEVVPDSINIANAYYGFDGGVVYPESCQTACSAE
jgi:hypothetical protein